jgi:hypothetical protein
MIGLFLPIFFCFVLICILLVSLFVAALFFAVLFFYEGYKGISSNEILRKALPLSLIVFLFSNFFCCISLVIYYSMSPFYIP